MNELVDKIKQNGYWKIVIRPTEFMESRIQSRDKCKEVIEQSQIKLRGWDFPHIDRVKGIFPSGNDNVASSCDWPEGGLFEYWKLYQNGQFISYKNMIEDFRLSNEEKKHAADQVRLESWQDARFLSVVNALYTVTEAYSFAAELAKRSTLGDEVAIEIELGNVFNRTLFFWGQFRFLFQPYTCHFDNENIIRKVVVSKQDLVENFASLAMKTTIGILNDFGWHDVNENIFQEDQRKLLERRL